MPSLNVIASSLLLAQSGNNVVGTKVLDLPAVIQQVRGLIADKMLREDGHAAGQYTLHPADGGTATFDHAVSLVSCGDGKHTGMAEDYVVRSHRGQVGSYLFRGFAERATNIMYVVYSGEAYRADPDVQKDDVELARAKNADYVIVTVIASAAPAVMPVATFLRNLAGGNNAAKAWDGDEIRRRAVEVADHAKTWATVAD